MVTESCQLVTALQTLSNHFVVADSSEPPHPAASIAAPTNGANNVARTLTTFRLRRCDRSPHHPRRVKRRRLPREKLTAVSAHILAVAYGDKPTAERALARLQTLACEHALVLEDAAVAVKLESGKVALDQTRQLSAGEGLVAGGSVGLLLGLVLGVPIAGAIAGLSGGGGLAAIDRGIRDESMKELTEKLEPGHAAVFALVKKVDWQRLRAALAPLGGELLAAQLDDVVIDSLGAAAGPEVP